MTGAPVLAGLMKRRPATKYPALLMAGGPSGLTGANAHVLVTQEEKLGQGHVKDVKMADWIATVKGSKSWIASSHLVTFPISGISCQF
ncbi:hypothetical protein DPMN_146369 [Dreissena polymorpha]|uniref:Uncharacterized protein n=1 Tax=Dreissena polymorpha TaxID=45954 RepID=A0A9D4FA68_DREPO|nr:hypothetical protein DPMN_146369 [Dreissena polymorpha]